MVFSRRHFAGVIFVDGYVVGQLFYTANINKYNTNFIRIIYFLKSLEFVTVK